MHDPLVVAFEIRRPWPRVERPITIDGQPERPRLHWPTVITVWHREPGGHDALTVCRQHRRNGDQMTVLNGWRFHIHHWKLQFHPLQRLRRRLLTRCTWCGGRSRKGDVVNMSHQWDGPRGRWWQGEPGLYHGDCSSIASAHTTCACDDPLTEHEGYGQCARCGLHRPWGMTSERLARVRELQAIPAGTRPSEEPPHA